MKSPPILADIDVNAEAQVAQSRADSEAIIRDHLNNHLAHNTGASSDYISWIATLHPENANVEVDQRFFIPGNPWWSIYEETLNQMPYATAVAVGAENESQSQSANTDGEDGKLSLTDDLSTVLGEPGTTGTATRHQPPPHFCLRCNPIDMCLGVLTAFHAVLATFIVELLALIFYFVAAFFFYVAQSMEPPNLCNGVFYSFFMIFYFSFAMVDSTLLLASVLSTELLILVGWLVSCLFGGIWIANQRHQHVRRVCHHIRWAFRHSHLNPPRSFCGKKTCATSPDEHHNTSAELQSSTLHSGTENTTLDTEAKGDTE